MTGRPPVLARQITYRDDKNQEVQTTVKDAIINAVAVGVPRKFAAQAAGVSETALHRALKNGREILARVEGGIVERDDLTENDELYASFAEGVEKADGQAVSYAVAIVRQHMPKNWPAAMTWLERRHPAFFARRVEVDTDPGDREPTPLDPATAAEIEEAFDTAHVPEGIEASDVLPNIGGDDD